MQDISEILCVERELMLVKININYSSLNLNSSKQKSEELITTQKSTVLIQGDIENESIEKNT